MITTDKGLTKLDGTETEVMADTMCILGAIYRMLADSHDEEYAKKSVAALGEMAVAYEERKELMRPAGKKEQDRTVN